jgi:hypothetical protein
LGVPAPPPCRRLSIDLEGYRARFHSSFSSLVDCCGARLRQRSQRPDRFFGRASGRSGPQRECKPLERLGRSHYHRRWVRNRDHHRDRARRRRQPDRGRSCHVAGLRNRRDVDAANRRQRCGRYGHRLSPERRPGNEGGLRDYQWNAGDTADGSGQRANSKREPTRAGRRKWPDSSGRNCGAGPTGRQGGEQPGAAGARLRGELRRHQWRRQRQPCHPDDGRGRHRPRGVGTRITGHQYTGGKRDRASG